MWWTTVGFGGNPCVEGPWQSTEQAANLMGYEAHVRFTEPVDPRVVWEAVRTVVEAPNDYAWARYAPGGQMGTNGCWFAEPEQGAKALACMYYGAEGSPLDDTEYNDPDDDWAPAQIPPAGYVEAHIWASYRYTSELVERAHRLAALVGVPAAIRDDFTGCWKPIQ